MFAHALFPLALSCQALPFAWRCSPPPATNKTAASKPVCASGQRGAGTTANPVAQRAGLGTGGGVGRDAAGGGAVRPARHTPAGGCGSARSGWRTAGAGPSPASTAIWRRPPPRCGRPKAGAELARSKYTRGQSLVDGHYIQRDGVGRVARRTHPSRGAVGHRPRGARCRRAASPSLPSCVPPMPA